MHAPGTETVSTWKAMAELKEQGVCKLAGQTCISLSPTIYQLIGQLVFPTLVYIIWWSYRRPPVFFLQVITRTFITPWFCLHNLNAVNQLEITPYLQRREIVEYCHKNGIVVEGYSPLTKGQKLIDQPLVEIAAKYMQTWYSSMERFCPVIFI